MVLRNDEMNMMLKENKPKRNPKRKKEYRKKMIICINKEKKKAYNIRRNVEEASL